MELTIEAFMLLVIAILVGICILVGNYISENCLEYKQGAPIYIKVGNMFLPSETTTCVKYK